MQLPINFASLVVLSTFALTGVSGKCFTSSINWSNKDKAVGHVEAACRGGVFTGVFKPGQRKYLCVRVADNLKWEFAITNQDTRDSFDLQDEHGIGGLSNEVRGCDKGGVSSVSGWEFSSDPNVGYCN
ncbi:uncharacterized protein FFB20_12095 [Fusarium fujikuroi]|uniref:Uncharacterized protein n=2 Tax=Fusarium fujikuroi TaxID=5127 RepID=S0EP38_GIBF5|nr:uncharacterized protein FFUJ_10686 [Fusarium fujikuroi IMI 58289]KLO85145.1 uncharacterized protein Y057_4231 [Fusarium fujikuroi]KLO95031.1 uncharacterized protein LW93_3729 [Fusarium fujikuroi]KLO96056.1 uncharacterized protein LW94_8806 [Fusarium fujikuroi]QGI70048.1 hypothetical protein CEK27_002377 [Fusarium fujikuroi]QGJ00938.1 hypothetical protein CEK26_002382 [Fusarium fujikuroi]